MKGENFFGNGVVFMELSLQEKLKLIEFFEFLLNEEISKPLGEMNSETVDDYISILLHLQGKKAELSSEYIDEQVRKIPFVDIADIRDIQQKKRKKIKKKKILLIAAIIAILLAILAVFSTGHYIENIHRFMKDTFGTVHDAPVGENILVDDKVFVNNGTPTLYANIDDFCKKEKIAVLVPDKLPNGIEFVNISITNSDKTIIVCYSKGITSYEIYLDKVIPQTIHDITNETVTINGLTCYICRFDDINATQVYFEHNKNYYSIGGTNEQILLDIIENLEEYK